MEASPVKNSRPKLKGRLRFEEMISNLSARFINLPTEQLDSEIELALKRVLDFFQVDRCALLRAYPGVDAWEITHAVYSENIPPVPTGTILSRSIHPWAFEKLVGKGEVVLFARVDEMPDEAQVDKQTWRDWGIRSNLVIPIPTDKKVVHVIAINAVKKERTWPDTFIPRLQLLGEIFVNALERRKAEQALRDSKERLSLAAFSAEAGLWELDCSTRTFWASERARRIFGYGSEEAISMERFEASVHPDDLRLVRQAIAKALSAREPIDLEYRILVSNGRSKWISSRGRPYFKLNGEPDRLLGVSIDISERKQMEAELKERLKEIEELKRRLENENMYLREELRGKQGFERIVGESKALKSVVFAARQVASTDATVLILGETGTGKGMMANAIHQMSARKDRPLVTVNCSALPQNLFESELFGREKGAFTGAHVRQAGRFEVADGGTIFLDEIGDMSLELQSKLLRVLQEGEFERLGSPKTIKVDVRLIAATSRDLMQQIRKRRFREDLYYRLNVFPIQIPPLRQRTEDIPLLAQFFTEKYARKMGKKIESIPKATLNAFKAYHWPGNVRELEHVIERAVIITRGTSLQVAGQLKSFSPNGPNPESLKDLAAAEREHILKVLHETGWKIEGPSGAASILKIHPSTLRFRLKKLGIHRPS
jgi:PAS domain S-box-containing protein